MVKDEDLQKIKEIIGGMSCPKSFKCAESGFSILCKANDLGIENYLACLDEEGKVCLFALPFGSSYLCQCPLRVFLAKKLNK